ncbi:hypothetical protein BDZ89DRAFT_997208 [Hymenopellis radicata]|nr:hypothetical protein BDZ89DRAFT_997208 [Hymenopellis radicata]
MMNALNVPRATTYTAQALYDQIHSGDITLDRYQRDVVWSKDKQIRLIDSVLRNFYIPPVIFAVNTFTDGTETKTCIDGKQRLTSIHRFMDGLIPHQDPHTGQKLWYKADAAGSNRRILPPQYQRLFSNKQVVCVEYTDLIPKDERDIFQRVQMGVALTPAEKLGANDTHRSRWVKELCANDIIISLPFLKKRGSDFRVVSSVLLTLSNWRAARNASAAVAKWVESDEEISTSFKEEVEETFNVASRLKFNIEGSKVKRLSPIEMIGQLCLLHVRRLAGLSEPELQKEANALHTAMIESDLTDLRMNHRCGTWVVAWIKGRVMASPGKSPRKRKRSDSDDEDEGDSNPQMLPSPKA